MLKETRAPPIRVASVGLSVYLIGKERLESELIARRRVTRGILSSIMTCLHHAPAVSKPVFDALETEQALSASRLWKDATTSIRLSAMSVTVP
jgi:hypothetical protein